MTQFHLIGIGGAGMSVVAELLAQSGFKVRGSDARASAVTDALEQQGIKVYIGQAAENVDPQAIVVVSSAIKDANPELACARARGQRILHRSQALALASEGKDFVAVAGAHGKTTTSGMLAQAFSSLGLEPSFAVGGTVSALGTGGHLGNGSMLVAEADESDGSFLNYHPRVEVVLNVEPDHLDHYGTREAFEQAFVDFSQRLVPGGLLVTCADDAGSRALGMAAAKAGKRVTFFGLTAPEAKAKVPGCASAQLTITSRSATGTQASLEFVGPDGERYQAQLNLHTPGDHVALDACGAWAAGIELGVEAQQMADALSTFAGTGRRFEKRGEPRGVEVVDDYAHHPTEVEALLSAAREVADARGGRLLVLFQPHLFSRTRNFAQRFSAALAKADKTIVIDIYPARETQADFPQVTSALLANGTNVQYVSGREAGALQLASEAKPGDLVLTVGAGDVTELANVIIDAIGE